MRILHLVNSLALGGAERLISILAPLQAAAGHEVAVAALSGREDFFGPRLEAGGIRVLRLSAGPVYDLRQCARLRRLLSAEAPEILHVHLFPAQYIAAFAARGRLRPPALLTTEHGAGNRRMGRPFFKALDRGAYGAYDARVAVGTETAGALEAWTGLPFSVIENGIELGETKKESRGKPGEAFRIGVVGRLSPPKDPFTILKALALLPPAFMASFVGEGELRPRAEALAAELGLGQRPRFLGRREDVKELLLGFDLLVHASGSEGLPLSVLEAMAAGLPCLLSDIPALREVGGDAALYFPHGDHPALAERIQGLAADPRLAAELGSACRKRAEGYDIGRTCEAYLALYSKLLERNARCPSSRS